MIERLAIPAWDTPPTPLTAWTEQMAALGHPPSVAREDASASWIEVAPLRLRGFAVAEGDHLEAINFEIHAPDPAPALDLIARAAEALGWELHDEPDDEGDAD